MERPGRASVGAIVLAGGRGSRLGGVDKATLIVDGSTLLDTVLAATEGCVPRVVVGPPALRVPEDVVVTREEPVFSGPASAVAAGSVAVATRGPSPEWTVLLACDVPGVGPAVPRLIEAARSADTGVEALFADDGRVDGRTEWLVAIVRTDALTRAIDALGPGGTVDASMRRLLSGLPAASVPVPRGTTADIDTPADAAAYAVDDPRIRTVRDGPPVDPAAPADPAVPSAVSPRTFVPEGHHP